MYNQDDFTEMVSNWQFDNAPEYDDLVINDPVMEDGRWTVVATDDKNAYELSDDGTGNIVINYLGTR